MLITFLRRALPPASLLLASVAHAADTPPKCSYANTGTLAIRYLSESFHPALEGVINGTPAAMLIDTGADDTFLTRRVTDRLKLPLRTNGERVIGIGGMSRTYSTNLREFGFGPWTGAMNDVPVVGDSTGSGDYDAVIGVDILLQTDMEIALADKQLRFFEPQNCDDRFLGYWSEEAYALPFEKVAGIGRNPAFEVELNGRKLMAAIDSGAAHSVVYAAGARKAGIDLTAPGVKKGGGVAGTGLKVAATWHTVFDTFTIGPEVIRNADIDIVETPSSALMTTDMLLGADFLRAHRVLFAMSQKRLYISYLGGSVFTRSYQGIEPWLQREADNGNAAAEFALAMKSTNQASKREDVESDPWMKRAFDHGDARASRLLGLAALRAGRPADAIARLSTAISQDRHEPRAYLFLYLASLHSGDAGSAARKLETRFAADKDKWPAPIAEFYLGRIDAARLMTLAAQDSSQSWSRSCEANEHIGNLYAAQGDIDKARALRDSMRAECASPPDR